MHRGTPSPPPGDGPAHLHSPVSEVAYPLADRARSFLTPSPARLRGLRSALTRRPLAPAGGGHRLDHAGVGGCTSPLAGGGGAGVQAVQVRRQLRVGVGTLKLRTALRLAARLTGRVARGYDAPRALQERRPFGVAARVLQVPHRIAGGRGRRIEARVPSGRLGGARGLVGREIRHTARVAGGVRLVLRALRGSFLLTKHRASGRIASPTTCPGSAGSADGRSPGATRGCSAGAAAGAAAAHASYSGNASAVRRRASATARATAARHSRAPARAGIPTVARGVAAPVCGAHLVAAAAPRTRATHARIRHACLRLARGIVTAAASRRDHHDAEQTHAEST